MLLSEIIKNINEDYQAVLFNEKNFDRFARTTSKVEGTCCVFIAKTDFISTIPNNATMVITTPEIAEELQDNDFGLCLSSNPKALFFKAFCNSSSALKKGDVKTYISETAQISDKAVIASNNVRIGNNTIIEDFVTINENVVVGDNCIIRSGAQIGIQDYNYYFDGEKNVHLPHFGQIIISNDVEIGYNSMVGQALYPGDITYIGANVKVGFFSLIGHDAQVHENVMIYDKVILGGYTTVGKNSRIALSSTIKNGLTIGENVQVDMGSVVIRDIPDGQIVFGNPARRVITPKKE